MPNALTPKDFYPQRIKIRPDPPNVASTIRVRKNIHLVASVPSAITISPSQLMAGVPGGLTYWSKVRIESFSVWAKDTDTLLVTVLPSNSLRQAPLELSDTGIPGSRRAAIAVKLGMTERMAYWSVADTFTLFDVDVSTHGDVTIIANVELISNVIP